MAKANYEGIRKFDQRRPFIITRACYSGSQKYATAWTGDNHSIWAHLQMAVPQLCNLGLSGMAFVGTDVGGFGSDCTPELLCRWTQVGCFSPLFRNHSAKSTRRQEPWAFNEETLSIVRKYIKLRYRLLPYLYDLFRAGEETGLPVMRPLVMEYQQDEKVREINDQFLFGSNIMAAPVVNQGQKVRAVYLPQGSWIDYWTKEVIQGGTYILKEAPLDTCPIYIKAGSILPNYPDISYVGEKDITELTLDVYPGAGEYRHFQDNGEDYDYRKGIYNEYCFSVNQEEFLKSDWCTLVMRRSIRPSEFNGTGRKR
jgi:alpha-glucosidase